MDVFVKDLSHYRRNVDLIRDYVDDAARYISTMSGDSFDEAKAYVTESITKGHRALQVPRAVFLRRGSNGDRTIEQAPFNQYLSRAIGQGEIMAPTLTTYLPAAKQESLLAAFTLGNLERRSKAKGKMFEAEMNKQAALAETYNSQQTTFKIKNNALSGAHSSPFTPLWNKTAHSTLTSVCRTATSYANANNEKFLYGNRHYFSPDIVKTNIISIVQHSDYSAIERVMSEWQLKCPDVEVVMSCIVRGSNTYWRNPEQMQRIRILVERLTPIERAAFLYTNDLYHLAEVNPEFVRTFLVRLSAKVTEPITDLTEADAILKSVDNNLSAFVSILCAVELKGKNIKAARKRWDETPSDYGMVAANARHKCDTIEAYADFIKTFWVTDNLPSSIYSVPGIVRKGVLTSDTDSTIFTVQNWVEWLYGKIDFSPEAVATANAVVYIAGQLVRHILATLCGNMGVEPKYIFRLKMKNEYYFPVFNLTTRAKHYYAYMAAREGLVFEVKKHEIKGVALRSSAIASRIIELSHETMFNIMDTVMQGNKYSLTQLVRKVATLEREVLDAVSNGSFEYFKKTRIQDRSAYKAEDGGNYQHYELWEEVFADKYGPAPEPPYQAIKAKLITDKRRNFIEWIETMEDRKIAEKLKNWAERKGKLYIGTLYMPQINLIARGVPTEISMVVDTRALVAQLMESFYLILEGMGVYARNKKNTRLLSDDKSIPSLPEGVLTKQDAIEHPAS